MVKLIRVICTAILVGCCCAFIVKAYNDGYEDGYNHRPKWKKTKDEAGVLWDKTYQQVSDFYQSWTKPNSR